MASKDASRIAMAILTKLIIIDSHPVYSLVSELISIIQCSYHLVSIHMIHEELILPVNYATR